MFALSLTSKLSFGALVHVDITIEVVVDVFVNLVVNVIVDVVVAAMSSIFVEVVVEHSRLRLRFPLALTVTLS